MSVSSGSLSRRHFGDQRPDGTHVESCLRIDDDGYTTHAGRLEHEVLATHENLARAPLDFLFGCEIQCFGVEPVRFALHILGTSSKCHFRASFRRTRFSWDETFEFLLSLLRKD